MVNNKDVKRGIVLYLDGKAVENSSKAIRKEMSKVKAELDKLIIGTDEYTAKARQYQALNAALKEHKVQMMGAAQAQQNWLNKGIALFNQYSVAILGAAAAITGVAMQLSSFRSKMNDKEEAGANLKALTGLDDDSIAWLRQQAEELSTTMERSGLRIKQSSAEILEAYTMVGSKKPELLQDKEALNAVTIEAMRLASAAKIDLKDAVAGVTLAMNQYGAAASEAARYTNTLAAGSKFGAVGVATQTESIVKAGVAASVAKVPIEQLVGVLETLGERGIEGNRAGTQLKTFLLKLEAGADETRPSVVGLQQALETLKAKGMDAGEMVKMFGLESYTAAAALIESADKVKYYTDAVTGTSVATEQAAINSNTAAAKMAQLRNQINETGMALAKDLAPIFSKTVNLTSKFVMMLPPLVRWLKEYGGQVAILAATILLYNTYAIIAARATAAWNAVVGVAKGIAQAYSVALVQLRLMQSGCATAQIGLTRAIVASNAIQRTAIAVTSLFRAAMLALTGQTAAASVALKGFRIALASTGVGAIIVAVGALAAGYSILSNRIEKIKQQREQEKELNEGINRQYNEQAARIANLRDKIRNETLSIKDRKAAINELKTIVPAYEASLDNEGKLYEKNKTAIDEYLRKLRESITMRAASSKIEENMKRMLEIEDEMVEKQKDIAKYGAGASASSSTNTGPGSGGAILGWALAKKSAEHDLKELQDEYADLEKRNEKLQAKIKDSAAKGGSLVETPTEPEPTGPKGETDEEHKKRVNQALENIEAEHGQKLAALKEQYLSGEIATEMEYNNQVQQLEMERLNKILDVAGLEPKKREEVKNKILDIKRSTLDKIKAIDELEYASEEQKLAKELQLNENEHNERLNDLEQALQLELITQERYNELKLLADAEYNRKKEKAQSEQAQKDIAMQRAAMQASLLLLQEQHLKDNSTEDEYRQKRHDIIDQYYQNALANQRLSQQQRKQLKLEYDQWSVNETQNMVDANSEKMRRLFDVYRQLGEDIGKELAEFVMSTEKSLRDLGKAIFRLLLDTLQKILTAAIAERTIRNIATLGFAGVAKAAGEIALLTAAFEAAKAGIEKFDTGGYTGEGRWNEPAGVVHKGEFVANRFAVANPAVKNILDVIDAAQRSGTVQNLTRDDIRSVGYSNGGYTSPTPPSGSSTQQDNQDMKNLLRDCTDMMQSIRDRFKKPLVARTYASGKYGTMEAEEFVNKMQQNATRQ